jgi:hypothetical protein
MWFTTDHAVVVEALRRLAAAREEEGEQLRLGA